MKKKVIIIIVVLIALGAGYYFFIYKPKLAKKTKSDSSLPPQALKPDGSYEQSFEISRGSEYL